MSEAVERLAEALWEAGSTTPGLGYAHGARLDTAEAIFAADPALAEAIELGLWLLGDDGPRRLAEYVRRYWLASGTPEEAARNIIEAMKP